MNWRQRILFASVVSFAGLIGILIISILMELEVRSVAQGFLIYFLAHLPLAAGIEPG